MLDTWLFFLLWVVVFVLECIAVIVIMQTRTSELGYDFLTLDLHCLSSSSNNTAINENQNDTIDSFD